MAKRTCSIVEDGKRCGKPNYGHGWCLMHWARWYRHGDPLIVKSRQLPHDLPAEERFWLRVDKGDGTGCWLWTGGGNRGGYGIVQLDGCKWLVHRYAYTLLVGPIPEGLTLDHVKENGCTSTLCVKAVDDEHGPSHLEPCTSGENSLRGESDPAKNARKTHCPQGHPYDEANTWVSRNGDHRICRTCRRENMRRYSAQAHKKAG